MVLYRPGAPPSTRTVVNEDADIGATETDAASVASSTDVTLYQSSSDVAGHLSSTRVVQTASALTATRHDRVTNQRVEGWRSDVSSYTWPSASSTAIYIAPATPRAGNPSRDHCRSTTSGQLCDSYSQPPAYTSQPATSYPSFPSGNSGIDIDISSQRNPRRVVRLAATRQGDRNGWVRSGGGQTAGGSAASRVKVVRHGVTYERVQNTTVRTPDNANAVTHYYEGSRAIQHVTNYGGLVTNNVYIH
ncbi:hypothetical protein BJ138DRAFT_145901 [Hygrophoropsis aurantiaca]|uniref:Uncharacterized protein n=1 Tax=Hygrophoropsis aurantiaca TaxID=72124 RepID=A0ACB8AAK6_9AGAM|nr:hypothetical protein BJ138DRAFT_145901 [Hygrophoropsis aurantiaca]